ncbi:vacuolar sorting protein VPS1 [Colletotrichum simmondsii]|uniref:Vacuolar sorting protein VPS1 n=1 Tax=Colletotrichum simmondsii TaxID=703756 RepID=A0A135RP81_9PEZI|nr:vacuolar sorting protein VPS1 [Colletotrichum simmondsii]
MDQPTTLSIPSGLFEFERKSPGLPISPVGNYPESQGAESQVDYAAGSGAVSPCYDEGKSSLLQSLTDIPFPVGSGCCTRFATRIVSRRTAPGSRNSVKVTIVEPDVTDKFGYPPDDAYKEFPPYVTDHLGVEEFTQLMETITTTYMGIKRGKGHATKNFASQVLRIELSGPSRSHFSILDVPGIFSYAHDVNEDDVTSYGTQQWAYGV